VSLQNFRRIETYLIQLLFYINVTQTII